MYDRQYEDLVYSSWEWKSYTSWPLKGLNKAALTSNHLISPYNFTSKSHIKVTRIKEMITKKKKKLWMVKKILPVNTLGNL